VDTVYVLIRPNHELSGCARLDRLLKSEIFRFYSHAESQLVKIKAIEGDIRKKDLGLTSQDRLTLVETVDVIIHIAASVKFDSSFK